MPWHTIMRFLDLIGLHPCQDKLLCCSQQALALLFFQIWSPLPGWLAALLFSLPSPLCVPSFLPPSSLLLLPFSPPPSFLPPFPCLPPSLASLSLFLLQLSFCLSGLRLTGTQQSRERLKKAKHA